MTKRGTVGEALDERRTAGVAGEAGGPSGGAGGATLARGALRAGDDDRRQTVAELQRHFVAGRLTDAELGERVRLALAARTFGELDALMGDLPRPSEPVPAPVPPAPSPVAPNPPARVPATGRDVRAHVVSYLTVMALLVGIWLLTTPGGYFWPAWPMLGWGIGVVSHAAGRGVCGPSTPRERRRRAAAPAQPADAAALRGRA